MFACEAAGVAPDIITLSKALTGGTLPLAATVATRRVFDAFWSDDPGARADARADLYGQCARLRRGQRLARPVRAREPAQGRRRHRRRHWRSVLDPASRCKGVRDVRVKGAIGVVELDRIDDLNALKRRLVAEGVWVRPFRNIVYLTPALTIDATDLKTLTDAIRRVVGRRE